MSYPANYMTLYTTRAHVFQINTETKTSWIAKGAAAIPVSVVAYRDQDSDATNNETQLKIYGINEQTGEIALDCPVSIDTAFNKRSQKFVQWPDNTGMVYGLGFSSETDLNQFLDKFLEIRSSELMMNNRLGEKPQQQEQEWNGLQNQQNISSSESNGRAQSGDNLVGSARSSGYSNSSMSQKPDALVSANNIDNGVINDGLRHPQRSQSTMIAQSNRSGSVINDATSSGLAERISPEADDIHSVHSEHQIRKQLKYENERLKAALEESSKNSDSWRNELANLRTNNAKLTQALQDSKSHVQEWEKELQSLRNENDELKLRIIALESTNNSEKGDEYKVELQKYKDYIDQVQSELRQKENDVEELQRCMDQMKIKNEQNGDTNSDLLNNNSGYGQKLETINAKLEAKINELVNVQKEFGQLIDQVNKH